MFNRQQFKKHACLDPFVQKFLVRFCHAVIPFPFVYRQLFSTIFIEITGHRRHMGIQDRFKILSGISLFGFCSAVLLTRFQPAVFGLALQQLRIGDSDICKPNTIFLYRLFDDQHPVRCLLWLHSFSHLPFDHCPF